MSRKGLIIQAVLFCSLAYGQQTSQWSQYLFNHYGFNPAIGGSNNCLEMAMGRRHQWWGFDNAPVVTMVYLKKTFGKKRFKKEGGWYTMGMYFEQDDNKITKVQNFNPSFAYHTQITRKWYASAGVFAGVRIHSMTGPFAGVDDPAVSSLPGIKFVIPDITAGAQVYNKNTSIDLAVKQIFQNKVKGIGTPTKLRPHFHITAYRNFESSEYYYTYRPSVHIKYTWLWPPAIDLSFMFIFKKNLGFGATYRYNDAVVGLLKYTWKGITAGLAYDYNLSRIRHGSANSYELMLKFSSCEDDPLGKGAHNCPAYDF